MLITAEIQAVIDSGAALAVSISGGKDSQALLKVVCEWHKANGLTNKLFAIHADLGRSEWAQTPAFVEKLCALFDIELVVVRRERDGKEMDLLDRMRQRFEQMKAKGLDSIPFPSAKARYCTSDLKRDPINRYLRQFDNVVSIEGICWHESKARSLAPRFEVRKDIATKGRKAHTWNAIIDYSLDDVWGTFGQSKQSHTEAIAHYEATGQIADWWNFHPAYAMGNTRLSCSICILGNLNDYLNGIKHNPEYADAIDELEKESGYTMKQGMSIEQARQRLKQGKL